MMAAEVVRTPRALDFSSEAVNHAAEIADGFWLIATAHRPGLSKSFAVINNRCLVFRLNERGSPVLLVVNAVDPGVIPEVRRIEKETGLRVRYVVSPGGGHHLMMQPWHDAFGEAEILLCPVRAPRTANGQKLMALPRVRAMDLEDPLPQFHGQLDAVIFHGMVGFRDQPAPGEGGPEPSMFRMMYHTMFHRDDPVDELWLCHRASGTVIGGENLGWMYSKEQLREQPFMLKQIVKPDSVYIMTMPRKVSDAAVVAACWKRVLAWKGRALITYHDVPTTAFVGDVQATLEKAVRDVKQL
jgi:hypothetical protein